MDEREKAELNKQKQIVDCIEHLNTALSSFDRLEDYKSRVLTIVDGLDLTHSDTYFEVTDRLKRELFYINFFTQKAAESLVKYRCSFNPDEQIYSVKEKKRQAKYGRKPTGDLQKRNKKTQRILKDNQKQIEELLQRQKQRNISETNLITSEETKQKLDLASNKRKEWQIRRTNRIAKIELDTLRLKWAVFLLFILQTAILIKLCL